MSDNHNNLFQASYQKGICYPLYKSRGKEKQMLLPIEAELGARAFSLQEKPC